MTDSTRSLDTLELVGGTLCLDFANTVNSRVNTEHDYLLRYADLAGWANKVGLLSPAQADRLQKRAKQNPDEAEKALASALRIREVIYRLFSQAAKAAEPSKTEMDTFVSLYGESISHGQILKQGDRFTTTWKVDEAFDALLWPIVHSAGELLLSNQLGHVKECPSCGWLFLDISKNQSRRWCSMNTCGARDKMRRYHKKKKTN
jgi:predicted RNA-binding Zn ribbon-like protein